MDKNAIKKYAVWARRELISRVSQKALQLGISDGEIIDPNADSIHGHILSGAEKKQRQALIARIKGESYEQVMEEVAYTWFNRFIALRFMEVNGYLPTHVRVFTNDENAFSPQILTEAIHLELDGLDMERVYALKEANDDEALYKYLLITQCNALSSILPGMFQRIADYTELLFPDNILREGSAIERMIAMIPEKDWKDAVQIIGWSYQYYNTEPKDKVFADLKRNIKISRENIPAATQLFTPDWIVRYMVENSLGRLWVEGHPSDTLKANWRYYLEEAEQEPEVEEQLKKIRAEYAAINPEEIRCIDPCMGSGHILVYLFDVLMQIYEAYGYSRRDAVASILQNNLYGLDIDERAAQLAYFAVMMKARAYDARFLTRNKADGTPDVPQPHTYAIIDSNGLTVQEYEGMRLSLLDQPRVTAQYLIDVFHDAREYGSIIAVRNEPYDELSAYIEELVRNGADDLILTGWLDTVRERMPALIRQAKVLSQKYHVVVTNPPYMGSSGMDIKLAEYVKRNYPDSKSDLFAVFIERCVNMTRQNGYQAMITQHAWMFLSSFERLRGKLLMRDTVNMAHLGARAFDEIGGEVVQTTTFVLRGSHISGHKGVYCRLIEPTTQQGKEDMFLAGEKRYAAQQDNFTKIPGSPVAYWVSEKFMSLLCQKKTIGSSYESGSGLSTADNERFLRFFWEVNYSRIATEKAEPKKWFLFQKGGEYRKWYGNIWHVVNWENEGAEIKYWVTHNSKDPNTTSWSRRIFNTNLYFKRGITWSVISSGEISFRVTDENAMISNAAGGIFGFPNKEQRNAMMSAINTKIWTTIFKIINPTLNYSSGVIQKAPAPKLPNATLGNECVELSKIDWDSFEISWDFMEHPLVANRMFLGSPENPIRIPTGGIKASWKTWELIAQRRFDQLKANEEELNRIFIDIYGLQDELTPEVEDKDVTVRLADKKRDVKSLISYAVGCMFGRYSLDVPGLVYAGGDWDESKYRTFPADKDNIIPICDDEYFADDMVGRFIKFIEIVYGKETLAENLRFIADALGGTGQPKDVIRSYFLNDFYVDHLRVYQKRPIYWLFDSGKKGGFRALIYMHRYQPDTIARMRTDYVHEQQARYHTAIADLQQRMAGASTAERVKLNKQLQKLQAQAEELRIYEEKIHHLADQMIRIDLDDGVKHNYEIFKDVLAAIN